MWRDYLFIGITLLLMSMVACGNTDVEETPELEGKPSNYNQILQNQAESCKQFCRDPNIPQCNTMKWRFFEGTTYQANFTCVELMDMT